MMHNVLYGAAYYNEYMPDDLQPGRLEKDVALMQQAGISVVRMGESTWSLWEPADGSGRPLEAVPTDESKPPSMRCN